MEIDDSGPWRTKLIKTIRLNYAKAPHFAETFQLVESLLASPERNVARFNETGIRAVMAALGLGTPLVRSSDLDAEGSATELLIETVRAVGGTHYLSGDGASGYQEDAKFSDAGLTLVKQNFEHPTYPQRKNAEFVPGLSVVDALMWIGAEATGSILRREAAGAC